jgi:hypothetical protein
VEDHRTRSIYNWLQYFSPDALQEEIRRAGFRLESFFANVAGDPFQRSADEFAVVGRKI